MTKINKVAVLGMGKSGKSALALALRKNYQIYAVNSGDPDTWFPSLNGLIDRCSCFSQDDFAQHFHKMDQIILSPGIPVTHPSLQKAVEKGIPIISEIEFAWLHSSHIPVIAITGTNGKTTTTTMIAEVLKASGKKVFCGGNIGVPYSDLALSGEDYDFAVIEVSSFQLETTREFHPRIGVILNIFSNHTERYNHTSEYAAAKFRLLEKMDKNDDLIYGTENDFIASLENHPVTKHAFTKGDLPKDFLGQIDFSRTRVTGEHNQANFYVAYKVLNLLGLAEVPLFQRFVDEFKGVPHRLEFVLESEGLSVYNDAKSTNALATTTAIRAFPDSEPFHLILGGKLRNEDDRLLPDLLPYQNKITTIIVIGEVTERLHKELSDHFRVERVWDIAGVLKFVRQEKLRGNLVFSPGFPSFDQFKNYEDRGETFKKLTKSFFNVC